MATLSMSSIPLSRNASIPAKNCPIELHLHNEQMTKRHGGFASAAKSALLWAQAKQSTRNNSVKFHGGKSRQSIGDVTFDPSIVPADKS
jgi:hypothetical protein